MLQSIPELEKILDEIEQLHGDNGDMIKARLAQAQDIIRSMHIPEEPSHASGLYQEAKEKTLELLNTFITQISRENKVMNYRSIKQELVFTLRIVVDTFQLHIRNHEFHKKVSA